MLVSVTAGRAVWRSIFCLVILVKFSSTQNVNTSIPTDPPEVTTIYGRVLGSTTVINGTANVDVFLGVPYAQPPIGSLRLKKPEPPTPWSDVKVVTSDNRYCVDTDEVAGETEDCLYLDVYRPRAANSSQLTNSSSSPSNASLSVIVWIHGGGWQHGSKNKFNGTILAAQGNVIVVMINYRLGALGFFSTEDDVIPGNFGLLDQIAALKWVQSNIAAFGGDPNSVTIIGESAGSQATSLLLYSPLARGLFARAVMQSAVATGLKLVDSPTSRVHYKDIAMEVAERVGCTQTTSEDLLQCLQTKNFREFVNASTEAARNVSGNLANAFKPRVESTFGVLPDYPVRLLARGEFLDVDTMRGFNSQENGKNVNDKQNNGLTRKEFITNAHKMLEGFTYMDIDKYVDELEDLYISNVTDPFVIRARTIDMKTDFARVGSIVREAKLMQRKHPRSNHFLYQFDYFPSYQGTPDWQGVLHALNVPFEFGFAWVGRKHKHASPTDLAVADMMMEMWANFAKFGDPTPRDRIQAPLIRWKKFYSNKFWYLVIRESLEIRSFTSDEQVKMLAFWEKLVSEYMLDVNTNSPVIG